MIVIADLRNEDRGRLVSLDDLPGVYALVNWNERYLFLAELDTCPASGGHCEPGVTSFAEGRATWALRFGLRDRPFAAFSGFPKGYIEDPSLLVANPGDSKRRFGCLDYPITAKPTESEAATAGLVLLGPVWRSK